MASLANEVFEPGVATGQLPLSLTRVAVLFPASMSDTGLRSPRIV